MPATKRKLAGLPCNQLRENPSVKRTTAPTRKREGAPAELVLEIFDQPLPPRRIFERWGSEPRAEQSC